MVDVVIQDKELVVEINNEPGAAAIVFDLLGSGKINVDAMVAYSSNSAPKQAWLHFHCDDLPSARKMLRKAGYKVTANPVIMLKLANRPGYMATALKMAAAKMIDFEYAYGSTAGRAGFVVLRTQQVAKALRALQG